MLRTLAIGKRANGLCTFVLVRHKKIVEALVTESLEEPLAAAI